MKFWVAPSGLHIEPGKVADAEPCAKLHAGAFFRGWPAPEFAAFLNDPRRTPSYIACDKKHKLAGFAMLRIAEDEAELLTIVVGDKWRGRGVGAAIMAATLDDLTMSPVERYFLEVEQNNSSAIALYKRYGFIEVGTRKGYYKTGDGKNATALIMRLDLD